MAEQLELLKVDGKSREYALPLEKRDMPNIFVEAVTIARGQVVTTVREIVLPPEKRLLSVEVLPGQGEDEAAREGDGPDPCSRTRTASRSSAAPP